MAVRLHRAAPAQSFLFRLSPLACACIAATAHAQQTPPPAEGQTMAPVVAKARAEASATVGGWGDVPLSQAPFQATVITSEQIRDRGVTRVSDALKTDPGVTDSYNTGGYYDSLTVRGFKLDNEYNYRRDGLPINARTVIGLENKENVEVLKGTSGIQAGTSAPGGLVNYVVKRPTAEPVRRVTLGWEQSDSLLGAVDLGQRFGTDDVFGVRLNVASARMRPQTNNDHGERYLAALAADWRVTRTTLIEVEAETGKQRQPSVPGFSMRGNSVPSPADPNINLNNQPWSQPMLFKSDTASVRITQNLNTDWRATLHAMTQQLKTDDRVAFPYGCTNTVTGETQTDRYCSDGTVDIADYRSENERRRTDALEFALYGKLKTGVIEHDVAGGLLRTRTRNRFYEQLWDGGGLGNDSGTAVLPAGTAWYYDQLDVNAATTEYFVRDALKLPQDWTVWLGLRHTELQRDTQSGLNSYTQSINTPSVAVTKQLASGTSVYASWGQGAESKSVPSLGGYTNSGAVLPVAKSTQTEVGVKAEYAGLSWGVALFQIERPEYGDIGGDLLRDGESVHRGIEANAGWRSGSWRLQGGVQYLHARRENSADPIVDGKRPVNVPQLTGTALVAYTVPQLAGLSLWSALRAESERQVTPNNDAQIGGYGLVDLGAKFVQKLDKRDLTWRAGVDNVFDRRAWRESPYEFSHVYLFPTEPRTFRLSLEASL
jgi:iron complex outermembrane receptor protein